MIKSLMQRSHMCDLCQTSAETFDEINNWEEAQALSTPDGWVNMNFHVGNIHMSGYKGNIYLCANCWETESALAKRWFEAYKRVSHAS